MTDALFDAPRVERPTTSRELVPVVLSSCPSCGAPLDKTLITEKALFFHGGYGADRSTTTLACQSCPWSLIVDVTETSPRESDGR